MNNPVRIQKVLSDNGILSRRKAEDAIRQNRVSVNGHPAALGQKIDPRQDHIALDGVPVALQRKKNNVYIMLHKPRGYVTTTSDEMGRSCVTDLVDDAPAKVYPVGRLDKQSEGLLLLTNDGEFANQIMHPRSHVAKTYRVTVRGGVTEDQLVQLATGVEVDGRVTLPASVHMISGEAQRSVIQLTLYEGRNRQVRKMCEALKLTVARLKRISVGPLKLGMLQPGKWRELTPAELVALRASVQKSENRARQEESFHTRGKPRGAPRRETPGASVRRDGPRGTAARKDAPRAAPGRELSRRDKGGR